MKFPNQKTALASLWYTGWREVKSLSQHLVELANLPKKRKKFNWKSISDINAISNYSSKHGKREHEHAHGQEAAGVDFPPVNKSPRDSSQHKISKYTFVMWFCMLYASFSKFSFKQKERGILTKVGTKTHSQNPKY